MDIQGTISAYQSILANWDFKEPQSFSENFAITRYQKKMQKPDPTAASALADSCFNEFVDFDAGLPDSIIHPSGEWYRARLLLHSWIRGDWRRSPLDFPTGSSFLPTRGANSIESRLSRGRWTCTPENFIEFSRLVYNHKALKRAFRRRYTRWYRDQGFGESMKLSDRILWSRLGCKTKVFQWKLERVVTFVRGSRFSTVPKNNDARRPINLEPLGNILVQRQQGVFLRDCLRRSLGIDLTELQHVHRRRISSLKNATIDLKNASDSVSLALCSFLLPSWFFRDLLSSRSPMLYGLDGDYHIPRKISSMGNGFTFELMTVILTAVCRTLDPQASVYGDDIIIDATAAPRLIELLNEVGFVVNRDKSFIKGKFRESCGGNFHEDEGYIPSFDFEFPETIADCALIYNKCAILAERYPAFEELRVQLERRTPNALRGGPLPSELKAAYESFTWDSKADLPIFFAIDGKRRHNRKTDVTAKALQLPRNSVYVVPVLKYLPDVISKTPDHLNAKWHWAKYEMYLHAGRRCDDIRTGGGRWVVRSALRVDGGMPFTRGNQVGPSELSEKHEGNYHPLWFWAVGPRTSWR